MLLVIKNILLLSVAVFLVAKLMPSIRVKNFATAIAVAIVFSVISFLFGRILVFLSLPMMILSFGLFKFVINAFLLWVTDKLIDDFEIQGLVPTLLAAFLITVVDSFLKWLL
jgi:putative membrane protein